jgi:hypothetical protein
MRLNDLAKVNYKVKRLKFEQRLVSKLSPHHTLLKLL